MAAAAPADELHAALTARNAELEAAGYHAQVAVSRESSLLFLIDANSGARLALKRIAAESPRTKPVVTRFKGLGEMSPLQLRETTMAPQTRRLVQMTIDAKDSPDAMLDMLLAKKRAGDRREWLESKGNLARI